jgi:hypothetical protein
VSKVIAIALLLVFAGDTILPGLFTGSESKLPACCRRNGKHHCASMNMQQQAETSGPAIKAIQTRCPYFPAAAQEQTYSTTILPKRQASSFALIFSAAAGHAQTEARFRLSFSRASQKRGPPTLL